MASDVTSDWPQQPLFHALLTLHLYVCVQAIPYCWLLFFVPMHFLTFELLLFATGVWTTNIHDCIHAK